jgi:hypothetical protein
MRTQIAIEVWLKSGTSADAQRADKGWRPQFGNRCYEISRTMAEAKQQLRRIRQANLLGRRD